MYKKEGNKRPGDAKENVNEKVKKFEDFLNERLKTDLK